MKRIIVISLAVILLLPLVSCAKENAAQPTAAPSENAGVTAAPGEPDGTAEPVRDPYEDFNNHYMQAYTNGNKVDWAEMEDYVFLGSKYYDKNTGECDFYCSKPECSHTDRRTCQAALYVLGTYDGKIYSKGEASYGVGIYSHNLDRSEMTLLRNVNWNEEGGLFFFHRGKLYSYDDNGTVVNAEPRHEFRLLEIDPYEEESRVIFESNDYPAAAWGWVFILNEKVYLLLDYHAPDDAEQYPGCYVWELWSYNIYTGETTLEVTDPTMKGRQHGSWITKDGEIYAMMGYDTLVKLTDGRFETQWRIGDIEEVSINNQISDGVIVSQICSGWVEHNPDVRFLILDFEGKTVADGYLPFPDYGEEMKDYVFFRYVTIWADETCLWLQLEFRKPVKINGLMTEHPEFLAVKYDIVDGSYSLAFTEPAESFDF